MVYRQRDRRNQRLRAVQQPDSPQPGQEQDHNHQRPGRAAHQNPLSGECGNVESSSELFSKGMT